MAVILPRHAIDARSRLALEREVGFPELIAIDVVQERGEPLLLLQPCGLPYAVQAVGRALPARCPGRAVLFRVLLGPRPWLHGLLAGRPASFARFPATMAESDPSSPCIIGFGSSPSRCGPLSLHARPRSRSPGFRSRSLRTCQGLRPRRTGHALALARIPVSPSAVTTASASQLILSRLDGWPIRTPADASPPASRPTTHGSGPMGFATPSS